MKCARIRRKISAFLDGEVTEVERQLISDHLKSCERCMQELAELKQIEDILGLLEETRVPPYLMTHLKRKVADEKPKRQSCRSMAELIKHVLVPVMAAILVIFSFVLGRGLGKAICQTKGTSKLTVQAELTNLTGISSLDEPTEGSLTRAYIDLVSGEE
jgi:predicted anti-sigma-YlaC factor YlaD